MPDDWAAAIKAAKESSFLENALGAGMHHTFLAVKEAEYIRVMRAIPEIDYELYLYTV
jgi:glutamine synthetase